MKKYTLELTERQARLLSYACDQFARLIMGQDWSYQQLFESAWERRCKEATGETMDEGWDGGWSAMREDAERLVKEIGLRFWGKGGGAYNGVHYDNEADILFDIYQVIRHQLWLDRTEPKPHGIVDSFPAHQFGSEPLAKIISKDE